MRELTRELIPSDQEIEQWRSDHASAWAAAPNLPNLKCRLVFTLYGKKYMGIQRATLIIDGKGKVMHVIPKVSPKSHDDAVLKALKELCA